MATAEPIDRASIHRDLERVRADFRHLLTTATPDELRRAADGPRWTNEQLLWHMAFGFLIVRRLLPLVRLVSTLPPSIGRGFAGLLQVGAPAFDWVNGAGPRGGVHVVRGEPLRRQFDHSIAVLHRSLDHDSEEALNRAMAFPTRWEPLFDERMTLAQVYRYGVRQYDAHRRQLTLVQTRAEGSS